MFIRLEDYWEYILETAAIRYANNKTIRHIYQYKGRLEILGAAGEAAAQLHYGLDLKLHLDFDHGVDFKIGNIALNIKATEMVPWINKCHLQWPVDNPIVCDAAILVGVDRTRRTGNLLGWASCNEIKRAPVNKNRAEPCREIGVGKLHNMSNLSISNHAFGYLWEDKWKSQNKNA